jgi:glyoxylase-like metal-dependent hydrolase (beta-lactamase superfamily II)
MAYTGKVAFGGPADVRELPHVTIAKLSVRPMDNNAYLLTCRATGQQCLIDAANEDDRLLELIGDRGLARVITTHRHQDHWQALGEVVRATGARTATGRPDVDGIPVATDDPLDDGDEVWFGDVRLKVIRLTGHTPGAVALLLEDPEGDPHLFTGDSLFPGGPGKTNNPAEFTSLMDDLEAKVFGALPDQTWVYPGHGKDTTLGAERAHLTEWRERGW